MSVVATRPSASRVWGQCGLLLHHVLATGGRRTVLGHFLIRLALVVIRHAGGVVHGTVVHRAALHGALLHVIHGGLVHVALSIGRCAGILGEGRATHEGKGCNCDKLLHWESPWVYVHGQPITENAVPSYRSGTEKEF